VQPNPCIARRDPSFLAVTSDADTIQIYPPKSGGVLRLERIQQGDYAPAGDGFEFLVRTGVTGIGFDRQLFQCSAPGALPTEVIDQSVAKHSIEPGDGRFAVLQPLAVLEAPDKRLLQDVLSDIPGTYPALQKGEKPGVVLQEHLEHARFHGTPLDLSVEGIVYSHPHP
jgi:hypothetical protein